MADKNEKKSNRPSGQQLVRMNWQRYEYGRARGHSDYCKAAKRNERFYLGGGLQWETEDKEVLELSQRMATEINQIMPAVNTASGYQIHNRMDIAVLPRAGDSDQQRADLFAKVIKQIADNNQLPWIESQVFADGLIQQRGYFEIRMCFEDNLMGEVEIKDIDPLDVIPDPDAKSYDPDEWKDVIVTRWLSIDEIRAMYGQAAADAAANDDTALDGQDFEAGSENEKRPKFGTFSDGGYGDEQERPKQVIDRQYFEFAMAMVAVYSTGDREVIPDDEPPSKLDELREAGAQLMRQMVRRVRWTVTTANAVLHDAYSPYGHFTVVPYFPFFRRGQTRGLVDNAISPQQILNKAMSQEIAIVNTAANSGWVVEEDSLSNMTTQHLEVVGASNGLVIEHKTNAKPPQKIQPNPVPSGIDRLIDRAALSVKETTGISDALRGLNGPEVSGVAIQAKQFGGQQALAVPLDNLNRTRHMLGCRIMSLVQQFYDSERVIRVTGTDGMGKQITEQYTVNQYDQVTGTYLNDLTVGKYDIVVSEQPTTATWANTQFQQGLELLKAGLPIPPEVLIKYSNLSDKPDILKRIQDQQQSSGQPAPLDQAKIDLMAAQAKKWQADSAKASVGSIADATAAAAQIVTSSAVAPVADEILASAGFKDSNAQDGAVSIAPANL